jgi:hypothetical protein
VPERARVPLADAAQHRDPADGGQVGVDRPTEVLIDGRLPGFADDLNSP